MSGRKPGHRRLRTSQHAEHESRGQRACEGERSVAPRTTVSGFPQPTPASVSPEELMGEPLGRNEMADHGRGLVMNLPASRRQAPLEFFFFSTIEG